MAVQTLPASAASSHAASRVSIFRSQAPHMIFQEALVYNNKGYIAYGEAEAEHESFAQLCCRWMFVGWEFRVTVRQGLQLHRVEPLVREQGEASSALRRLAA
jgi:hypothetical protein